MSRSGIAAMAAAGALALLVGLIVVVGGGSVATAAGLPPGGCSVPLSPTGAAQRDATLDATQLANARVIVGVGTAMETAPRGIAIALGAAMQESTMDSGAVNGRGVGLFQQQGALYADVDRADPADSAQAFYHQLLSRVPDYATPAVAFGAAAQAVQVSDVGPESYARWETWATALTQLLITGDTEPAVTCRAGGGAGPIPVVVAGRTVTLPDQAGVTGQLTFPTEQTAIIAAVALSYLGTPYAWGGGDANGPTRGIHDGGVADSFGDFNRVGFDCSGLMVYAFAQAGITLPRSSRAQQFAGTQLPWAAAQPGDLVFWGSPLVHHVALYLGLIDGRPYLVEAPHSGSVVQVAEVRLGGDFTGTVTRP